MLLLIQNLALMVPAFRELREVLLALPGDDVKVDFDTSFIEENSYLLFPLLALGTIGLVVVAIVSSLRSDEVHGLVKVEFKRDIIAALRMEVGGLRTEQLAKRLKLSVPKTARLLEEMKQDGIVFEYTGGKKPVWRMRGVGSDM